MGKQDSSQTRVVPVFDQLHAMDKSGKSWLAKLLNLPMRPDRRNPDILKLLPLIEAKWGNQEKSLTPSRSLLRWLVKNFDGPITFDSDGKTIFEYRPGSHGAENYLVLCRDIIKRE